MASHEQIGSYQRSNSKAELLADEAAGKAVELDDTLPEAHTARAIALANEWKWKEVESEFRRAIET